MTKYMFPLMVITLAVTLVGPIVTGYIADITIAHAEATATAMQEVMSK